MIITKTYKKRAISITHGAGNLVVGGVLSVFPLLSAQYAQSAEYNLEEIVVTAQKRSENVQDVPIAISAFSSQSLAQKGITNVAQISDFTPNIQIDRASPFAGSSTIISAFIRGIGQNDFAFNMEPGVGLYVDGVYFARTVGAAVDLLDVQRVEVLKGPQGTLFGRNTIGGAIHVITHRPGEELSSRFEVTAGRYDRLDLRGTVDIPLVEDKLYSSVAFSSTERDGYQKRLRFDPTSVNTVNPVTGSVYGNSFFESDSENFIRARDGVGGSTQGGENARSLRVKLLYTPTADFEFTLSADTTYAREEATAESLIATSGFGFPFSFSYNACIDGADPSTMALGDAPTFALSGICDIDRGVIGVPLSEASNRLPWGDHFITGDKDTSYASGSNFSDVTTWGFNGSADWSINDWLSVKSITAYRELESAFGVDVDASPLAFIDTSFTMNQEQVSQELQFNIDAFDGRLKSVLGAYYFQEEGDLLDTVTFGSGLLQVFGPNDLENKSEALFAHNNFQITDNLGMTFGVRYTREEKTFTGKQRDLSGFTELFVTNFGFPPVFFPGFAEGDLELLFPTQENKKTFYDVSFRGGFEYALSDDILAYVSYAQGYKSGGWTTRLTAPLGVSDALAAATGFAGVVDPVNPPQHDPEEADTYEVGLKSELFDRRLRLNMALFSTDYTGIQVVSAPTFTLGAPWFFNAGDARIRGAEIEMDASVTPNLVLNGAFGYLDAEYRSLDNIALAGGITLDHKLVNVPEESASLGGTYTFDLEGGSRFLLHADVTHKGEMDRDLTNTPELMEDGFTMTNLSLTYEAADSDWSLVLGGENITDERFIVTGNNNLALGVVTATYNRPRTWYLTVKLKH